MLQNCMGNFRKKFFFNSSQVFFLHSYFSEYFQKGWENYLFLKYFKKISFFLKYFKKISFFLKYFRKWNFCSSLAHFFLQHLPLLFNNLMVVLGFISIYFLFPFTFYEVSKKSKCCHPGNFLTCTICPLFFCLFWEEYNIPVKSIWKIQGM